MSHEDNEAFNRMSTRARAGLSLAQIRWELETSRQRLLQAIASASPRAFDTSLYGEAGLTSGHEAEHTASIQSSRQTRQ